MYGNRHGQKGFPMPPYRKLFEQFVDDLQALMLLAQRLRVTANQQVNDCDRALDNLTRMVGIVEQRQPPREKGGA